MTTRTCSKCGETKDAVADFYWQTSATSHSAYPRGTCKECDKARARARETGPKREEVLKQKRARAIVQKGEPGWAEQERERLRKYAETHREEMRARRAAWRERNPEYHQAYANAHPELGRARTARRRSKLADAQCPAASAASIRALPKPCPCGSSDRLELDHVVPVSRGGCANEHNLQWLCFACNRSKRDELPERGTGCPAFWIAIESGAPTSEERTG